MEPIAISVLSQSPVPVAVRWEDGTTETISLPKLGVRGLLPWLSELTAKRQKVGREVIARMNLAPIDRTRAEISNQRDEAVISDLTVPIQTVDGIERVLKLSMDLAKLPADKQEKLLPVLLGTGYIAVNLAQELSTLFKTEAFEQPPQDAPPAGQGQQSPATGGGSPLAGASSDASGTQKTSEAASGTTGSPTA